MRTTYKVGTRINLKKKEEFNLFTRISNKLFPYTIAILATYGAMDIALRANGL